jgi:DNA-binding ferritin-like protein
MKTTTTVNHKMNIGIAEQNRKAVYYRLERVQSDKNGLYTNYRNYHWNIGATNFLELYALYVGLHVALADGIEEADQDLGSSDLVITLMEKHEKLRWLLNSILP